ncbi:hypothetical protein SK571_45300 [Lentzea sp. BCCO 10_0798]|uniref:SPW repeat-containing integral membrane domain-containing protein n=1 Tax=Lentzea kristufekii TaxID=3095430 RepID=A0ABU4U7Q2_9PSEU|nr:hypothetical protein [Lentzea sp. BCCO 10_0798]MDX8056630.1 hypothetical protein [Lentzea sp. BCCO 10_0798]
MREERRRQAEARAGTLTFLAGVWLVAAPPLLDFQASQHLFRPYWTPLGLAVVIMLAGMLRALAPLDVPGLRTVNIGLAATLVAAAFVRADVSSVVQINQVVVGTAVALVSLVAAIDAGRWLG